MSLIIDTGVFYALQNERATRHSSARTALSMVLSGEYGHSYTSDYIYDETVTLVRQRTGRFSEAKAVGDRILGRGKFPDAIELLSVSEPTFDRAVETFERYQDHAVSFTDAVTVALVECHDIDTVLTFDDDFDGIVPRLDPGTVSDGTEPID